MNLDALLSQYENGSLSRRELLGEVDQVGRLQRRVAVALEVEPRHDGISLHRAVQAGEHAEVRAQLEQRRSGRDQLLIGRRVEGQRRVVRDERAPRPHVDDRDADLLAER